ncbi:hypothetical protein [Larkinella terrae]|uniref:Uncharacterized protein n=1 Tax=Larkinella terrae TaxID=2025311 RepID=A0A7K0EIQ6_9BACT|nr:hypothetical protein [Larkinella terrae]MRS61635.1 hypothetical protein [Larkinella terrae]
MKTGFQIPDFTIRLFGYDLRRNEKGHVHFWVRILQLDCSCRWFDLFRSLFEYSFSEQLAVENDHDPDYAMHELELLFFRFRWPMSKRRYRRIMSEAGKTLTDV